MANTLNDSFKTLRALLVWRVTKIVRDPEIAEDIAQETYLRARRAMDSQPVKHLEGFLHRTAHNLAIDYLRRRRRETLLHVSDTQRSTIEGVADQGVSAEAALIEKERFGSLQAAISQLPARVQKVMILNRLHGWSNRQIAAHLGVTERTVSSDLKSGIAHCRDALRRHENR